MKCFRTLEKLTRFFACVAVAAGLAVGMTSAQAAGPSYNYCPPCYNYGMPSAPGMAPSAAPTQADPNAPAAPSATPDANAQQPQANQDLNLSPQSSNFQAAASGEGNSAGHIGRLDNVNRFNIFDSQSAIPANRVWYGFQYVDKFAATTGVTAQQAVNRFGGELLLTNCASVSFVTSYNDVAGNAGPAVVDNWSNPQILVKQVAYQDCDLTITAAMGIIFPIGGIDAGETRENTARLQPGFLWYYNTSDDVFNYGSFAYSAPLASGDQVDTLDWSFGTGYWLYRSCCCCDTLQSVSLQWEIMGKHVAGTTTTANAFGPGFVEDRHVVDMTFGASAFLCNGVRASVGYSLPITATNARRNEIIVTIGYYF